MAVCTIRCRPWPRVFLHLHLFKESRVRSIRQKNAFDRKRYGANCLLKLAPCRDSHCWSLAERVWNLSQLLQIRLKEAVFLRIPKISKGNWHVVHNLHVGAVGSHLGDCSNCGSGAVLKEGESGEGPQRGCGGSTASGWEASGQASYRGCFTCSSEGGRHL